MHKVAIIEDDPAISQMYRLKWRHATHESVERVPYPPAGTDVVDRHRTGVATHKSSSPPMDMNRGVGSISLCMLVLSIYQIDPHSSADSFGAPSLTFKIGAWPRPRCLKTGDCWV